MQTVVDDDLAMGSGVSGDRLRSQGIQFLLHGIPILTIRCRACSREISRAGRSDCDMLA